MLLGHLDRHARVGPRRDLAEDVAAEAPQRARSDPRSERLEIAGARRAAVAVTVRARVPRHETPLRRERVERCRANRKVSALGRREHVLQKSGPDTCERASERDAPYDDRAAEWHALERARLKKTSAFVDGQIAAVTATNHLALVTVNADFGPFDVKLVNWLK